MAFDWCALRGVVVRIVVVAGVLVAQDGGGVVGYCVSLELVFVNFGACELVSVVDG